MSDCLLVCSHGSESVSRVVMATSSTAKYNGSASSHQYSPDVHEAASRDLKNQLESRISDNGTACDSVRGCEGRVQRMEQDLKRLERMISERDDIIIKLRAENRQMSGELLEIQLQKVPLS